MTNCQRNMCGDKNRAALQKKIQAVGLCLHDTALFLDTHPHNTQALSYFCKKREELYALMEKYESRFGALVAYHGKCGDKWNWVEGPWPWQNDSVGCNRK